MDPEKWALQKAKTIQDRRKEEQLEKEIRLTEENLKQAHTPELWEQLRTELKTRFEKLIAVLDEPSALVWVQSPNEITIKSGGASSFVSAKFEPTLLRIRIVLTGTSDEYKAFVGPQGTVVLRSNGKGICTPEQIAEELLDSVTKFI